MSNAIKFAPGITGKEFDLTNVTKQLSRVDENWPEDEFGAKLSLGANYGRLIETMGQGDIEMQSNGEVIDPPREPAPGTAAFAQRARERRARLQNRRPSDPTDAEITDVVGGSKTSLKKRRKDLETYGNF